MQEAKRFLAGLLQITETDLEEALKATTGYIQHRMQKRSGGYRTISVPPEPLKKVQRRILRRVLYHISLHYSIHGFRRRSSIVSNARMHDRSAYALRLDLENAFGNVRIEHFREFFRVFLKDILLLPALHQNSFALRMHVRRDHNDGGWPEARPGCPVCEQFLRKRHALNNAFSIWNGINEQSELPALMNRLMRKHADEGCRKQYREWLRTKQNSQTSFFNEPDRFIALLESAFELLLKLCFLRRVLPQGAPTSPYLLNLAIALSLLPRRLDALSLKIGKHADRGIIAQESEQSRRSLVQEHKLPMQWHELRYNAFFATFYADDIAISSRYSFNEQPFLSDKRTVKEMIIALIEEDGRFTVNRKKTKTYNRHKEHPLVTGLRLTPKGIVLPKRRIRWLRSLFHHAQQDPEREAEVKGHLAFLKMVYGEKLPRQLGIKT